MHLVAQVHDSTLVQRKILVFNNDFKKLDKLMGINYLAELQQQLVFSYLKCTGRAIYYLFSNHIRITNLKLFMKN